MMSTGNSQNNKNNGLGEPDSSKYGAVPPMGSDANATAESLKNEDDAKAASAAEKKHNHHHHHRRRHHHHDKRDAGDERTGLLDRQYSSGSLSGALDLAESMRGGLRESLRSLGDAGSSVFATGEACDIASSGLGQASILSEIFNITKNLIGSGVLSLPAGIAIYSNSTDAIYLASFFVVLLGAMFGYFCLLIAKSCQMTKSLTYRSCYQESVGDQGAILVALSSALIPALGNLGYSTMLGQTLQSLLESVHIYVSQTASLLLITIFAILPLCLLKNLNALAPFSILATTGILVTAGCMVVRAMDGTYQPGGIYYDDLPQHLQPEFATPADADSGTSVAPVTGSILPYFCMVFESWVMHYNAPRFYAELKDASISRFALAVTGSFGLTAAIYIVITAAGYLTFGGNSDGYILNNYSPNDPLATVSRLFVGISTLITFPLAFIGFRDGILAVFEVPPERQTTHNLNVLTILLLVIITVLASYFTDLGLINAVAGGTFAAAICFAIPAVMYRKAVMNYYETTLAAFTDGRNEDGSADKRSDREVWQRREVNFAMTLMVIGVVLGAIGVWQAVLGS